MNGINNFKREWLLKKKKRRKKEYAVVIKTDDEYEYNNITYDFNMSLYYLYCVVV